MRAVIRTIQHPSARDRIKLYPLGDIHLGARACNDKAFRAKVQEIKTDPLAYWLGMGDYCDFINISDPRFAARALASWIKVPDLADLTSVQRDRFLDETQTIADKCLGLIKGNHEDSIHRYYERAIYDEIVATTKQRMKNPPRQLALGFAGFIRLRLERAATKKHKGHYFTTDIFAHHGWGGGRLAGHKALKLERAMRYYDAELTLIGHWHTIQSHQLSVIGLNKSGQLRKRDRKGTVTGTWLEGHPANGESYAERAGYPPTPIGCPIIVFHPSTETFRLIS